MHVKLLETILQQIFFIKYNVINYGNGLVCWKRGIQRGELRSPL